VLRIEFGRTDYRKHVQGGGGGTAIVISYVFLSLWGRQTAAAGVYCWYVSDTKRNICL